MCKKIIILYKMEEIYNNAKDNLHEQIKENPYKRHNIKKRKKEYKISLNNDYDNYLIQNIQNESEEGQNYIISDNNLKNNFNISSRKGDKLKAFNQNFLNLNTQNFLIPNNNNYKVNNINIYQNNFFNNNNYYDYDNDNDNLYKLNNNLNYQPLLNPLNIIHNKVATVHADEIKESFTDKLYNSIMKIRKRFFYEN